MYNTDAGNDPQLAELGNAFQKLVTDLEKAQVEYDLGCEDVIATPRLGRGQSSSSSASGSTQPSSCRR